MIKKMYKYLLITTAALLLILESGCANGDDVNNHLNPEEPVMITVWNYYNGETKSAFDSLVSRFNDTIGIERGIIVDSVSHGDVNQLADETYNAASGRLGADAMPDLFAAYPENAYRIDTMGKLVDLNKYFSEEDLSIFRKDFIQDCRFGKNQGLKILPVVRSTENLYLNKTDWDKFSRETGADIASLSTWEGLADTARTYHEWSGGKAFLGIDSLANYVIITSVQSGHHIYRFNDGEMIYTFEKELAETLWDNLYVPYAKGYYANLGKFCSDDEKTGDILAYTGSSAGAGYFPQDVTLNQNQVYPIESEVLPYPSFQMGETCAILQGAGFSITQSDSAHESASAFFLKWLTLEEQNLDFAISSGYLPVQNEALESGYVKAVTNYYDYNTKKANPAVVKSAKATDTMLSEYMFYSNPPFAGSYEMRQFFDEYITTSIEGALMEIQKKITEGMSREKAEAFVTDETHFNAWYNSWNERAAKILESGL